MTNREVAAAIRTIYNHWWHRWKDAKTPEEADRMTEEGLVLIWKYGYEKLVIDLVTDLVNIVSNRVDGPAVHQRDDAVGRSGKGDPCG